MLPLLSSCHAIVGWLTLGFLFKSSILPMVLNSPSFHLFFFLCVSTFLRSFHLVSLYCKMERRILPPIFVILISLNLNRALYDGRRSVERWLITFLFSVLSIGQSLERNAEDISILMGRGVEMSRSESVQDSINTLQSYIDNYGQYR